MDEKDHEPGARGRRRPTPRDPSRYGTPRTPQARRSAPARVSQTSRHPTPRTRDAQPTRRPSRPASRPTQRHTHPAPQRAMYLRGRRPRSSRRLPPLPALLLAGALVIALAAVALTHLAAPAPVEPAVEEVQVDPNEIVAQSTESGIAATAPNSFFSSDALAQLEDEVATLEAEGLSVSFTLVDVQTGNTLSYNDDVARYPSSCAKAAYCAMVCETYGGSGQHPSAMQNCLVNSSNDAYDSLILAFGLDSFASWLDEVGAHGAAQSSRTGDSHSYPMISAAELETVWEEIYRFGTSGEAGAQELVDSLSQTNYSVLGGLLRDEYEVWSKPGWYFQDSYDITSTNDAGVVFSDCGPYVVAVMTDLNGDLPGLLPLLDSLNAAHGAMCGGSTESQLSEETTIPGYVG